ncbi:MAG: rhodanese-like domain-containing protein [Bacteroidales bacterium]|jgi:rhodanese-related sulfurtransferase|nr:rhodanese-like domain-containing protein [Bacteroidales bacterium]
MDNIQYISAVEAYKAALNGAVLVDVREKIETSDVWINMEDVVYIPFSSFVRKMSILPKDKSLILCCAIGLVSVKAAKLLSQQGYDAVFVLNNGLVSWQLAELPLKTIASLTCKCQCENNTKDEDQ